MNNKKLLMQKYLKQICLHEDYFLHIFFNINK